MINRCNLDKIRRGRSCLKNTRLTVKQEKGFGEEYQLNLDFQWNYHHQPEDEKKFPSEEESQSIYSNQIQHLQLLQQQHDQALKAHQKISSGNRSGDLTTEYAKAAPRTGMKRTAAGDGEIIQVQGGHIIRATGRKDRHSKVYTAKGPRDRRVRLSAHTAIQFYDVQDRLGYDRPSKAVDWLIKKAKNAIDKLSQSPPPLPPPNEVTMDPSTDSNPAGSSSQAPEQQSDQSSSKYTVQLQRHVGGDLRGNSSLMPPPAETQSVTDSMMKSLFPMSSRNSLMNLQSYSHDRISRTGIQIGDLGLSLQTLQDGNLNHRSYTDEVILSGTNSVTFGVNYTKGEEWNGAGEDETRHAGFICNSHSMSQQLFYNQNSAFSLREPLQSNYPHLIHSWNERQFPSEDHQNAQAMHQSSLYSTHFGSNFQVPARIHGEDEPGIQSIHPSSSASPGSQQL